MFSYPEGRDVEIGKKGTRRPAPACPKETIATSVVMQNTYDLKRTVLQVAKPKGEIDHGAILEMCEGICGEYTGADFGDFALKLLKLADGLTESTTKKAEALDMLEKGQIRVRTDLSFEEKALAEVTHLTGFVARAALVIAL